MIAQRLREISDQITTYKSFVDVEPGNQILINLLEQERQALIKRYVRAVEVSDYI